MFKSMLIAISLAALTNEVQATIIPVAPQSWIEVANDKCEFMGQTLNKLVCEDVVNRLKSSVNNFAIKIDRNGLFAKTYKEFGDEGKVDADGCKNLEMTMVDGTLSVLSSPGTKYLNGDLINSPLVLAIKLPINAHVLAHVNEKQRTNFLSSCIDPMTADSWDAEAGVEVTATVMIVLDMQVKVQYISSRIIAIHTDPRLLINFAIDDPGIDLDFAIHGRNHGIFTIHQGVNFFTSLPEAVAATFGLGMAAIYKNAYQQFPFMAGDAVYGWASENFKHDWLNSGMHFGEAFVGTVHEMTNRGMGIDLYNVLAQLGANEMEYTAYKEAIEATDSWEADLMKQFDEHPELQPALHIVDLTNILKPKIDTIKQPMALAPFLTQEDDSLLLDFAISNATDTDISTKADELSQARFGGFLSSMILLL